MLGENGCFVVRVTLSIWSKTIFRCGIICFFFKHIYFAASGQAVVTGVVPFPPPLVLAFKFYRAQGSAIPLLVDFSSSVIAKVTHALALSASQFMHKKKSPPIYTSMHSGRFELTKLTYTRLEDNLIHHRGDRLGV